MDLFDFANQQNAARIAELSDAIRRANDLYWNRNAPEISDPEYDRLVEERREELYRRWVGHLRARAVIRETLPFPVPEGR